MSDQALLLDRLATKFTVGDSCWEWLAATSGAGYGQVWDGARVVYAHRVMYELLVGPIPDGLQLDHLCRNRWCVRPAHLEPVTMTENIARGAPNLADQRRSMTHCGAGHEYTEANTYVRPDRPGTRECRACHLEANRRHKAKRRADRCCQ